MCFDWITTFIICIYFEGEVICIFTCNYCEFNRNLEIKCFAVFCTSKCGTNARSICSFHYLPFCCFSLQRNSIHLDIEDNLFGCLGKLQILLEVDAQEKRD